MKAGKEYEILIEQLYKKLDPESRIKRNDKILGHDSKINREIDISIRHSIGPHEVLMIVQAKDHKTPIDVNVMGEFITVVKDVRANKGIIISTKGFTDSALSLAKTHDIDALTGHDLSNPKWAIDLRMPVILYSYTGSYTVTFTLSTSQEYADMANSGKTPKVPPWPEWKLTSDGGKSFFTIGRKFLDMCSNDWLQFYDGEIHTAEYTGIDLQLYVMEGVLTPLYDFKYKYRIHRQIHYKYFEVKEFQGLINRQNNVISRANVKVEGEEFVIINFDIITKKDVDLSTWNVYDDSIELIHPYRIKCSRLSIGIPQAPLKFEFLENRDPSKKKK